MSAVVRRVLHTTPTPAGLWPRSGPPLLRFALIENRATHRREAFHAVGRIGNRAGNDEIIGLFTNHQFVTREGKLLILRPDNDRFGTLASGGNS
jgi:hypothetical protein